VVAFTQQVIAALRWLEAFATPGDRRRPVSSYDVKHRVQRWAGHYVSGPAVVATARVAGFPTVSAPTKAGNAWISTQVRPHGLPGKDRPGVRA
jgi:hypothetical protein